MIDNKTRIFCKAAKQHVEQMIFIINNTFSAVQNESDYFRFVVYNFLIVIDIFDTVKLNRYRRTVRRYPIKGNVCSSFSNVRLFFFFYLVGSPQRHTVRANSFHSKMSLNLEIFFTLHKCASDVKGFEKKKKF